MLRSDRRSPYRRTELAASIIMNMKIKSETSQACRVTYQVALQTTCVLIEIGKAPIKSPNFLLLIGCSESPFLPPYVQSSQRSSRISKTR